MYSSMSGSSNTTFAVLATHSAGARASTSETSGEPSSERTSGVVSRILGWARGKRNRNDMRTTLERMKAVVETDAHA